MGQMVNFTVDAYPDKTFQGKVKRVRLDSKILQNVVTYDVVIEVSNPDELLLPGMTAFVNIVLEQKSNVLKLPLSAFKFRPKQDDNKPAAKIVYKRVNNEPVAITVETGISDSKYTEIISADLAENDELILEDLNQFKDKGKDNAQGNFKVKAF
jgi:HlyD family secretion protein